MLKVLSKKQIIALAIECGAATDMPVSEKYPDGVLWFNGELLTFAEQIEHILMGKIKSTVKELDNYKSLYRSNVSAYKNNEFCLKQAESSIESLRRENAKLRAIIANAALESKKP